MGLDSVELVMAFEDEFEIQIPNEAAEKLQTIRDVTDYVTAHLAAEGRPRERASVYAIVCLITCEQCGTTLDKLTEDTTFINDLGLC